MKLCSRWCCVQKWGALWRVPKVEVVGWGLIHSISQLKSYFPASFYFKNVSLFISDLNPFSQEKFQFWLVSILSFRLSVKNHSLSAIVNGTCLLGSTMKRKSDGFNFNNSWTARGLKLQCWLKLKKWKISLTSFDLPRCKNHNKKPSQGKGKVCIWAKYVAHQAGAYPGFCSMK